MSNMKVYLVMLPDILPERYYLVKLPGAVPGIYYLKILPSQDYLVKFSGKVTQVNFCILPQVNDNR